MCVLTILFNFNFAASDIDDSMTVSSSTILFFNPMNRNAKFLLVSHWGTYLFFVSSLL